MTGVFAECQPQYAKHGIPTFPVRLVWNETSGKYDKIPGIKRYMAAGIYCPGVLEKFGHWDALGFPCTPRTGIFVSDMDGDNPAIITENDKLFGPTPLVWRTISGHYAGAYRNNGRLNRKIKPKALGLPIDLLGNGFAVAPPSHGPQGGGYEIIRGTLDDLARLPDPRIPDALLAPEKGPHTTADSHQHQIRDKPQAQGKIQVGQRNGPIYRLALMNAAGQTDIDIIMALTRTEADCICAVPYEEPDLHRVCEWALECELAGHNYVGHPKATVEDAVAWVTNPYVPALHDFLRRLNGPDAIFMVADALNEQHLKWPVLLQRGTIVLVQKYAPSRAARYRWGKTVHQR